MLIVGCASALSTADRPELSANRTVYLLRPMALWSPGNSPDNSLPYELVEQSFKPYYYGPHHQIHGPYHEIIPYGSILTVLATSTPMRVEKLRSNNGLNENRISALGTVELPATHQAVHFEFFYRESRVIPWGPVPP